MTAFQRSRASTICLATREKWLLLTQELSAQGAVEGDNFVQRGPDIALPARDAELLSMAFHELATNAVKHGALSAKDGRIYITWVINHAENGEHVLVPKITNARTESHC